MQGRLGDSILNAISETLDDIEKARTAMENRNNALTTYPSEIKDPKKKRHALGLPKDHPQVVVLTATRDALKKIEDDVSKELEKQFSAHPLAPWIKSRKGLGLKQTGRLLAAVGDPYWHDVEDRPRLVSELWAYCGLDVRDGAAPRKKTGAKSNWNNAARMRAWNMAQKCMQLYNKVGGPYGELYYKAKEKYADAVHLVPCAQCTPKGKPPAEVGSALKDGHKHARALRIVSKEILRDLWTESKRLYEEEK